MEKLDDSGKEVFETYCEAESEIEEISRYRVYTYALKFGILLMAEVFVTSGEITGADG